MFEEIEDATGFLLRFLYDKVPRRKVSVLGEQFANFLVLKYHDHWDETEPRKDAEYRCIKINQGNGISDANLTAAVSAVGLDVREVLQLLPDKLTLWVNPREVLYRQGNGPVCPVPESHQPINCRRDNNPLLTPPISPLKLSRSGKATCTNWLVADTENNGPTFEISAPHDLKFTVGTFSKTRFGTTKIKSDPMKQLIGLMTGKGGQVAGVDEHRSEQMDAKILKLQPPPLFRQNHLFRKPPTPPEIFTFDEPFASLDRRGRPILGMQYER